MAELETYHTQKSEDFKTLMKEHLDGEIAFYEQVCIRIVLTIRLIKAE
jgi:sorting nexin-9/18/33